MVSNNYILAMYDIRSKQSFIYRSSAIKEIAGGSLLIRDCFKDYLYPAAERISNKGKGIFHTEWSDNVDFTRTGFEQHLKEGYIGELIYEGGGNFLVVYRDIDAYRDINYEFSKKILEDIGTLQVLPTFIKGVNFDDYPGDRDKLYAKHTIEEGMQSYISPWGTLPIVQVDYSTSEPLTDRIEEGNRTVKLSKENAAKRKKYTQADKTGEFYLNVKLLDDMVQKRGEESLLAVIYADGNNMGAKVESCIKGLKTYEECIKALRYFSADIQKKYIDDRVNEIFEHLEKKYGEKGRQRLVVGSGDEITFICNARHAYDLVNVYLGGLPENCSACAGIAVFHSHAPYAEAYRIAEECCEQGKKYMRNNNITDACFIDSYYCQGSIGTSLEEMREEETGDFISKPWRVGDSENTEDTKRREYSTKDVEKCVKALNELGRSNVKGLAEAAKDGALELTFELKRIRAHMKKEKRDNVEWEFLADNPSLVYDVVTFYDIWFDDGKAGVK